MRSPRRGGLSAANPPSPSPPEGPDGFRRQALSNNLVAQSSLRLLPPTELLAQGRACESGGAVVLVAEDDAAFLKVIGRHLHYDAVTGERLDAVLLHLACRVGDDLMAGIELYPVSRVRQDFGHQALELNQLFLRHDFLTPVDRRFGAEAWRGSIPPFGIGMRLRRPRSPPTPDL